MKYTIEFRLSDEWVTREDGIGQPLDSFIETKFGLDKIFEYWGGGKYIKLEWDEETNELKIIPYRS